MEDATFQAAMECHFRTEHQVHLLEQRKADIGNRLQLLRDELQESRKKEQDLLDQTVEKSKMLDEANEALVSTSDAIKVMVLTVAVPARQRNVVPRTNRRFQSVQSK
jgi:hypothetical protein